MSLLLHNTAAAVPAPSVTPDPAARALIMRVAERMGGLESMRAVERVRLDLVTQWQVTAFGDRPYPEQVGYELNTDVRDYSIDAWRNTRRFVSGPEWRSIVDLVRGDVAVRDMGGGFAPLNIAYVDERDELFAYTPDRLVLAAVQAAAPELVGDTVIDGVVHDIVRFEHDDASMRLFVRRADELPTLLRFRAAAPNDFGLVPWGEMEVEVWYSAWTVMPNGLRLPRQWDIRRLGRPYKRITVVNAAFNAAFAADSFAVNQELRAAYRQSATKPMHDLPLDSARLSGAFIEFRAFGAPAGAVRIGGEWIVLEAGQAELSLARAFDWIAEKTGEDIAFVLSGSVGTGNGGVVHAVRRAIPVRVGAGALPYVERILANHRLEDDHVRLLAPAQWLTVGGDSVRTERLDLPNAPGSIVAWVPSLHWLWAPDALSPLDLELVRERATERGWDAQWLGTRRLLRVPFQG